MLFFDDSVNFVLYNCYDLEVREAWLQKWIFAFVGSDERLLGSDVLTWLRVIENLFKDLEKGLAVEL